MLSGSGPYGLPSVKQSWCCALQSHTVFFSCCRGWEVRLPFLRCTIEYKWVPVSCAANNEWLRETCCRSCVKALAPHRHTCAGTQTHTHGRMTAQTCTHAHPFTDTKRHSTHLTDLTYLLNLPAAPPGTPLTNDHLSRRLNWFQSLTLAGPVREIRTELFSDRGVWALLCLLSDGVEEGGLGVRRVGGALLCSAQCRTQETVALQGAESRSAPSSVSAADDECDLGRKLKIT